MAYKISDGKIGRAFIGRQTGRKVGEFLDLIKPEIISACIKDGKMLTDYLPEEKRYEYKEKLVPYYDMINSFSTEEFYAFLPRNYRVFIESHPGGMDWAIEQLNVIREFLLGT